MGPFPRAPLSDVLERRWLHYGFFTRDASLGLIANMAELGGEPGEPGMRTAVLLLHDAERGWSCSQWNAQLGQPLWSAWSVPRPSEDPDRPYDLEVAAASGQPRVSLRLRSTSTPSSSHCAPIDHGHWKRWQCMPGVIAEGTWETGHGAPRRATAIGYHERVRGRWGWPEMGGWVFGFCNDLGGRSDGPPPWAVVFGQLQPDGFPDGQSGNLMIWRNGRLARYFPRNKLRVALAGQLDRDHVVTVPYLSDLLGTAPAVPVPAAMSIVAAQGSDTAVLRFRAISSARLVIPSETSFRPFSVHETVGTIDVSLNVRGQRHSFEGPAVVEFAGGASEAPGRVY